MLSEFDFCVKHTIDFFKNQTVNERKETKPFAAMKTLNALRVTIKSVREVVDLQFKEGFDMVLTGKLNQDCLEVNSHSISILNSICISVMFFLL